MENNPNFTHEALTKHSSHRITVVVYGLKSVLECMTCGEELYEAISTDVERTLPIPFPATPKSCDYEEGCENCGS